MEGSEEVKEQQDEEEVEGVVVEDGECGGLMIRYLITFPGNPAKQERGGGERNLCHASTWSDENHCC